MVLAVDLDAPLRRNDVALDDDQRALQDAVRSFFTRNCPTSRVRGSEPLGFDAELWAALTLIGVPRMGVPVARGGDGASLPDLALVAEEAGRALAPVPVVESIVATRLLTSSDHTRDHGDLLRGDRIATIAVHPIARGAGQPVPAGAIADEVVGFTGDELVAVHTGRRPRPAANLGRAPLAVLELAEAPERRVLERGTRARERFEHAILEWKLLTAAALIGIADGALGLAVDYAKERVAFEVPIGTFQAIAHPLVDVATAVEGGRRLSRKAAWFLEHEPDAAPALVPMAFLHAARTANRASSLGIHVQGGFGFTTESDMQLHFRRAKGWALVTGDPTRELGAIADALYGPTTPAED